MFCNRFIYSPFLSFLFDALYPTSGKRFSRKFSKGCVYVVFPILPKINMEQKLLIRATSCTIFLAKRAAIPRCKDLSQITKMFSSPMAQPYLAKFEDARSKTGGDPRRSLSWANSRFAANKWTVQCEIVLTYYGAQAVAARWAAAAWFSGFFALLSTQGPIRLRHACHVTVTALHAASQRLRNAINSTGRGHGLPGCNQPVNRPTRHRCEAVGLRAGIFLNMSFLVTTIPLDIKPSKCPVHGRHASACKISPSYDSVFRR